MKRELKIIVPDIGKSSENLSQSTSEIVAPSPKEESEKKRQNNSAIENSTNNTTYGDG